MTARICYLHVGTGKTGSSAIQYALTKAHDRLLGQGYLYPDDAGNFRAVLKGVPTAGNAIRINTFLRDGNVTGAQRIIEEYLDKPHHLIWSCEGLSNRHTDVLEEFGSTLRALGCETRCLVFFRPQVEMIVSSYLQQVKSHKIDVDVELGGHVERQLRPRQLNGSWNWFRRARKLERAFGTNGLTVKWYPSVVRVGPRGVVDATFDWLGLEPPGEDTSSDERIINPTPGREALAILRLVNASGLGGKGFADALLSEAHRTGVLGGRILLPPDLWERIDSVSRESNRRLLEAYCPELAVDEELYAKPPPAQSEQPIDVEVLHRLKEIASRLLSREYGVGADRLKEIFNRMGQDGTIILPPNGHAKRRGRPERRAARRAATRNTSGAHP